MQPFYLILPFNASELSKLDASTEILEDLSNRIKRVEDLEDAVDKVKAEMVDRAGSANSELEEVEPPLSERTDAVEKTQQETEHEFTERSKAMFEASRKPRSRWMNGVMSYPQPVCVFLGFIFPAISEIIDLNVSVIECLPFQSGNKPTQNALKNSHRIPIETQPVKNFFEKM